VHHDGIRNAAHTADGIVGHTRPFASAAGIAVAATAQAIKLAKRDGKHRFMHAFPNVENAPSNAICRKLGFEPLEMCEFEFPKGHFMTCNDWRPDLRA
jgi:RimJ/RimL family protein N-acetyltransferase